MKHTLAKQAKLAVACALVVLGSGMAQAATFASADISVEARGEDAGGLTCSWREKQLGASQVINYTCSAGAVGAMKACVEKNKLVANSPTRVDIFKNVGGENVPFLSHKNGQISGWITTPIPPGTGGTLCVAPAEETVVAVRWCNTSLRDETYGLLGTAVSELFLQFFSGVGSIPTCTELQASP